MAAAERRVEWMTSTNAAAQWLPKEPSEGRAGVRWRPLLPALRAWIGTHVVVYAESVLSRANQLARSTLD
jgi:hypothetical protein